MKSRARNLEHKVHAQEILLLFYKLYSNFQTRLRNLNSSNKEVKTDRKLSTSAFIQRCRRKVCVFGKEKFALPEIISIHLLDSPGKPSLWKFFLENINTWISYRFAVINLGSALNGLDSSQFQASTCEVRIRTLLELFTKCVFEKFNNAQNSTQIPCAQTETAKSWTVQDGMKGTNCGNFSSTGGKIPFLNPRILNKV